MEEIMEQLHFARVEMAKAISELPDFKIVEFTKDGLNFGIVYKDKYVLDMMDLTTDELTDYKYAMSGSLVDIPKNYLLFKDGNAEIDINLENPPF